MFLVSHRSFARTQNPQLERPYNGDVLVDQPVLALTDVPEGGFFKRIWDAIKLFFVQLFQ